MQEISRRAVLVGAATATIALSLPTSAAGAKPADATPADATPADAKPAEAEALAPIACGALGSTHACVRVRQLQDVSNIRFTITNGGDASASYTVRCVDQDGGPQPDPRTVSVEAGETVTDDFFGSLQHCFTLYVCPDAGGDCLIVGPVCAEYASAP